MFAVRIDPKLSEYNHQIAYAVDYLFHVLGYSYRFLRHDEKPVNGEILFIYMSDPAILTRYMESKPRGLAICVRHDPVLYSASALTEAGIKNLVHEINMGYKLPYLSSEEKKDPLSQTCDTRNKHFYVGIFHFDLVGNIFFQLTSQEKEATEQRDAMDRYCYNDFSCKKYLHIPYLTGLINLMDLFVAEGEEYLTQALVQKPAWPHNKRYALALTHSVDRLRKWSLQRFFWGIFDFFRSIWRVKYHLQNIVGIVAFLFTNDEAYWNFDFLSIVENDFGLKSTYFYGTNNRGVHPFDYQLNEKNMDDQREELIAGGDDFALLASYDMVDKDVLAKERTAMEKFAGRQVRGIRQHYYRNITWSKSEYYTNAGILWDSSWSMPDLQGFINGCGYPFYLTRENYLSRTVMEMPVVFNDNLIGIDKRCTSKNDVRQMLDNLMESAREFGAMLILNFDLSTFEENKSLPRLYNWLCSRIKDDNSCWKAKNEEIYDWIRERESIHIESKRDRVIISSNKPVREINLKMRGKWRIDNIVLSEEKNRDQDVLDFYTENVWKQFDKCEVKIVGDMIMLRNMEAGFKIELLTEKIS